jgi:hypothetical protein
MFKPFKGKCSCHDVERWILNKKGECSETISIKRRKAKYNILRRGGGHSIDVRTGEGEFSQGIRLPDAKAYELVWKRSNKKIQKNKTSPPKRKPIQRNRKPTGEGEVFKEIFQKAVQKTFPEGPRCACCGNYLGTEARTFFFSHVLAKSTYPLFRLWAINIWLCCLSCHSEWDQGNRQQPKFAAKRFFAEKLKRFYYEIKDLVEEEQKEEMKIFEYEND